MLPIGFRLIKAWNTSLSLQEVVQEIPWTQGSIKIFGKTIPQPRLTCWMGTKAYKYSGVVNQPLVPTPLIQEIQKDIEYCTYSTYNSVLANQYRNGSDSVSWHSDDEPEFGQEPTIISLSLGSTRVFKIRENTTKRVWSLDLAHGDLLVMSGRAQLDYQHAVLKTAKPVGNRVNLTFRFVV